MSDEIKPALTPDEWAEREIEARYGHAQTSLNIDHKGRIFAHSEGPRDDEAVVVLNGESDAPRVRHAVAALCLYGQPFGFTREDVAALRREWESEWAGVGRPNDGDALLAIAAKITALLPPEP